MYRLSNQDINDLGAIKARYEYLSSDLEEISFDYSTMELQESSKIQLNHYQRVIHLCDRLLNARSAF